MRARRGNYALLFVITSVVLVGFLAFSIDVGRLRSAGVSAENAAEAAAMAALMELRATGSRARAVQAASRAANFVGQQGLSGGVAPTDIAMDIDFGEWDWTQNRDAAWRETPSGRQAVSVEVEVANGGIETLFYPALVRLQGGTPANNGRVPVRSAARAAMRDRDVILAVDVSRMSRLTTEETQNAIIAALNTIDDVGVPSDRVAVVGYAGDSWRFDLFDPQGLVATDQSLGGVLDTMTAVETPLDAAMANAELAFGSAVQVAQRIQPCYMGPEEFHRLYRFWRPGAFDDLDNPNWGLGTSVLYGFIQSDPEAPPGPNAPAIPADGVTWNDPNFISARQWLGNQGQFDETAWNNRDPLDLFQQCAIWDMSLLHWFAQDPRVAADAQFGPDDSRSPISCHAGAEIALIGGPPESNSEAAWNSNRNLNFTAPEITCAGGAAGGFVDHYTGIAYERWNFDDPWADNPGLPGGGGFYDSPDLAFAWAGSNPGSALEAAADIIDARADVSRDPVVVLIAGTEPRCGQAIQNTVEGPGGGAGNPCTLPYFEQATAAFNRLQRAGADLYVMADIDLATIDGVRGDAFFSTLPIGRGYYTVFDEGAALEGTLIDVLADTRIQVVQ